MSTRRENYYHESNGKHCLIETRIYATPMHKYDSATDPLPLNGARVRGL